MSTTDASLGSDLLAGVDAFCLHELQGRPRPLVPADLSDLARAASEMGLLSEVGLWTGMLPDGQTLRHLARVDTAAAHDLHARALAQHFAGRADGALVVDGSVGIGGAALGRWLTDTADDDDVATLEDLYGDRERVGLVSPAVDVVVAPVVDGDRAVLRSWTRDRLLAEADAAPHGLDGLQALTWRPVEPPIGEVPLGPGDWAQLLAAHLIARVAMACGAVERAGARAHDYARVRVQGGRPIVAHDAVAELLADIRGAVALANTWLDAATVTDLSAALAGARQLLPQLAEAANAAVQVHGGSGYMRDTGVEDALRDVNVLRVTGGSPRELGLVLAALHEPAAARPEAPERPGVLAGHVDPVSALSPWKAFDAFTFTRPLIGYEPMSLWERDTRGLPAPLAALRRRVRAFAERELRPLARQLDLAMLDGASLPDQGRSLLAAAGRAGLLSDLLPTRLRPDQLRVALRPLLFAQAVRIEELARVDGGLMLLLSANSLGAAPIVLAGDLHLVRTVVRPAFAANRAGTPEIFAYAITEPEAGSDVEESHGAAGAHPGTVARRVPFGWALRGRKIFISGGDLARWVVVFAALEGEGFASWTAFLVDTTSPGFQLVRDEHKMGMRASGAAELAFDDCFVPDEHVVGGLRQGWAVNRATLNASRIPVAAMGVGFAERALEIAADHACRATIAGLPIVHRQHVQLRLAEMAAEVRALRSMVWETARSWTPTQARASMLKFHVTDGAQHVVEQAMDLLGADAVLHARELERVFRDVRLTRIFEGTNQINRLAVIEDQQPQLLRLVGHHQASIAGSPPAGAPT